MKKVDDKDLVDINAGAIPFSEEPDGDPLDPGSSSGSGDSGGQGPGGDGQSGGGLGDDEGSSTIG